MNDDQIRQLAEEHWTFIERMLQLENYDNMIGIDTVHYLYVESGVHFAKHEREGKP